MYQMSEDSRYLFISLSVLGTRKDQEVLRNDRSVQGRYLAVKSRDAGFSSNLA